jgi:hypothetical protein
LKTCFRVVIILLIREFNMLAFKGIYENGSVILPFPVPVKRRVEVIVTFLEEIDDTATGKLDMKSFSFAKCREILKEYNGSIADAVIDERRSEG